MNRSVLYIAATLPFSASLISAQPAGAVEVPATPLPNTPVLSARSKPGSTITFMQREGDNQAGKFSRSLVIAAPASDKTTLLVPVTVQAPTPAAIVKPEVVLPVVAKAAAPKPVVATVVAIPAALTPPVKLSAEAAKTTGPVLEQPKIAAKSKELVVLNVSQPQQQATKPVAVVEPTVEKRALNVLNGVDLYPKTTPKVVAKAEIPKVTAPAAPTRLASREARAQQLLLARLDSDLAKAERRLQRSDNQLTEGQRQLGSINNILKSAMVGLGDEGKGLHPFVRVAQRYLGTPYVWGGESARGFDCSGFIMRVMRDLGYRALPHSAAEQFRYGTPIAKPLLKAGDVVFFANTYKPGVSHVGIYLGRGRFIHAANSQVGTIVSNLNEPKWVAHYAGARRLVSQ